MNKSSDTLLLISDRPSDNNLNNLKEEIQNIGFDVRTSHGYEDGLTSFREDNTPLVVIDSGIQGILWREAAARIKKINQATSILLLTSLTRSDESLCSDIDGVIRMPLNSGDLKDNITRCLNKGNQGHRNFTSDEYSESCSDGDYVENLILGKSKRIEEVKKIIRRVADADVTVLLRGESGTGKELAAQALFRYSKRRNRPFVKVLCAAIPDGLLESELFGHEKGAFTGAHRSKPGKFEFANSGTIFLDEIGDVPQSLQVKLLQVLQDGEFSKVGGREEKVDVRVIAATNKNLERSVAAGAFREDLYYRLNVVGITMPSLRERKGDILVLSEFFMHKYCELYNKVYRPLSHETMDRFMTYNWPGNVRELENVIKRIIVLGSEKIEFAHDSGETGKEVPQSTEKEPMESADSAAQLFKPCRLREIANEAVRKVEEETIKKALLATRWNKRKAAALLSISYKTLFYKMRQYNLLE